MTMMMKTCGFLFATLLSSVLSAPAVVWHSSDSSGRVLHSSEDLSASDLMKNVLSEAPEADLSAVVFLVGKGSDGSEQLSELASSGKLPGTSAKYNEASGVYHHVSGIESSSAVVREAGRVYGDNKNRVLEVSLSEFGRKLNSLDAPVEVEIDSTGTPKAASSNKSVNKRARALAQADVYIVNVSATQDAATIDSSITSAIENKHVGSVVLAGVRSVNEVKHERFLHNKRRMLKMEQDGSKVMDARGRRRLEEGEGEGDGQDNGNDLSGVYYVAMTPNMFSGLLFTFMFIVVAFTGISCMGDIQGGDTFTDKYPSLGREA
jgi:hypothetical protein